MVDQRARKLKLDTERNRASPLPRAGTCVPCALKRMGRVIKTNLGKYANPKLAQGAKAAVLASVVEYLNGEEFVRIVTAPLNYTSPDFVGATEAELGAMGVKFSPTNASFSPTNARQR